MKICSSEPVLGTFIYLLFVCLFVVLLDGVTFDGIPLEVTVTVMPGVTALFVFLCMIGIILAIIGSLAHFLLRNKT